MPVLHYLDRESQPVHHNQFSRETKPSPTKPTPNQCEAARVCKAVSRHTAHLSSVPTLGSLASKGKTAAAPRLGPPCSSRRRVTENFRVAKSYFQGTLIDPAILLSRIYSTRKFSHVKWHKLLVAELF